MKTEYTEEFLIWLMVRATLGIVDEQEAKRIIDKEKELGVFNLRKSIDSFTKL